MTKIDLITGFLGAGKTTFLKEYINYCLKKNERICILEFDYGAINVDMMLLQEFNNVCDMEMVAGGCDYDCHVRRFKTKLIAMGLKHYDRVIIEPSGIFDTDEFFDALYDEPICDFYEIGSVISIVDPKSLDDISKENQYLLASQIAVSGKLVLSKIQNYPKEYIDNTINKIIALMHDYKINIDENNIYRKPFNELNDDDFNLLSKSGYKEQLMTKKNVIEDNDYESLYFMNMHLNKESLNKVTSLLLNNQDYGNIIRIKGFIYDSKWYDFNITKYDYDMHELKEGQDVIIIIGENLDKNLIQNAFTLIK